MKFNSLTVIAASLFLWGQVGVASADSDTVRLGVSNDRSGIYSDLGGLGSEISVRMAVEDFGNSVLGKKIEVIGGDSQNKVDVASTMHYLKAAKEAGTFDADAVNAKMRELPIDSPLIKNARVRPEDGRVIMDMYQVEVKKPAESTGPNDVYKILATIPGDNLFVPLAESECKLVNKT